MSEGSSFSFCIKQGTLDYRRYSIRMKISFRNQDISNYENQNTQQMQGGIKNTDRIGENKKSVLLDIGNGVAGINNSGFAGTGDKIKGGKTITELQLEAGVVDNGVAQDYRTVLSNTMSAEDYAKARKEGFDYNTMDPDEVVTIQDRIKAEVAKGGEVIIGYNNDLSSEILSEALGSETLARSISQSFSQADIPLTEENIEDVKTAWELTNNITAPSDEDIAYIIDNELKTDLWSLYLAESSGANHKEGIRPDAVSLDDPANEKLRIQVENIVKAGKDISDDEFGEKMRSAQWLLDRGLPISEENIEKYEELSKIDISADEKSFAEKYAKAIEAGEKAVYADLSERESVTSKALRLEEYYFSEDILKNENAENIISRRQLEEVRLSMTAEVNIKLLKSDFSIDTAPIEDFISALKEAEKQIAEKYFPDLSENENKAVESYRLLNESCRAVDEVKTSPAAALGIFSARNAEDISLGEFHKEGMILRDTYKKAGESYEALMTAPRADLGDNIRKAFSNAESLAKELGIKTDEQSLRAIRILAYNSASISEESVSAISEADIKVRGVVEKMTPAAVLNMIRDGINPLEKNFDELNLYFESKNSERHDEEVKSYSEYLYGLERQDNITPEERESYIGIYRLIHQIEKNDGAVIGTVIGEQAELSFGNLLSAARTRRIKGVDFTVDEKFGGVSDIIRAASSITDQIGKAFEPERYYDEAEELRKAAFVNRGSSQILDGYGITKSADNLITAELLMNGDSNIYEEILKEERRLSDKNRTDRDGQKDRLSLMRNISDRLTETLGEEGFEEEYEKAADELLDVTKELELKAESYLDVKAMSLAGKQLGLSVNISQSANTADRDYIIPMELGGEISKVHISLRSLGENPNMSIKIYHGEAETEAYFGIINRQFEGYIIKNDDSEVKKLQKLADILDESLKGDEVFNDISLTKTLVVGRESKRSAMPLSNRVNRSKDAKESSSDGSERRFLLCAARIFLNAAQEAFRD